MDFPLPTVRDSIIRNCLIKGAFFYPGYYEDEHGRGDHIMIASPFIITEEQVDRCVNILEETLKESLDSFYTA